MRAATLKAAGLGLAPALLSSAAAGAATVGSDGTTMRFAAGAGEINHVTVSVDDQGGSCSTTATARSRSPARASTACRWTPRSARSARAA